MISRGLKTFTKETPQFAAFLTGQDSGGDNHPFVSDVAIGNEGFWDSRLICN